MGSLLKNPVGWLLACMVFVQIVWAIVRAYLALIPVWGWAIIGAVLLAALVAYLVLRSRRRRRQRMGCGCPLPLE